MTAQGNAVIRFRRAVDANAMIMAEAAMREMRQVSLDDALSLVLLYIRVSDAKAERAAVRWVGRLALEHPV